MQRRSPGEGGREMETGVSWESHLSDSLWVMLQDRRQNKLTVFLGTLISTD